VSSRAWFPTRKELVIVPYRTNLDRSRVKMGLRKAEDHPILVELRSHPNATDGAQARTMSELYHSGNPMNLLNHPAVVVIPYQVSTIQIVELYRLNIPMFVPSLDLLKRWCQDYDIMWEVSYGWPEDLMPDSHPGVPYPNDRPDMDKHNKEWNEKFDYWIPKSDFYQFPHLIHFHSWDHLFELYEGLIKNDGLAAVNLAMMKENAKIRASLLSQWEDILARVKSESA